ncbi:MAG TPA: ferritin family protein [Thermoanaerobaculia bacterium]|nr:ferritin family protein [Thermoanaerobaculia bacterium]
MKPLDTTPEEVLRQAIQSEVETRAYYQMMSERAGSTAVRARMLQLADAELLHRAWMERRYREVVGHAPPDPEPVKIELPSDAYNLDMRQALKHALERERESESHYRFMAERVPNTELGRLFMELAEVEWKHKTDLQAEYNSVTAKDPEQFLFDL